MFSIHTHVTVDKIKVDDTGIVTTDLTLLVGYSNAIANSISITKNIEIGGFDFGFVEDDGTITSANHLNEENSPTEFYNSTLEEWKNGDDTNNELLYKSEMWCVTCNDGDIYNSTFYKRYIDNFFDFL